MIRIALIVIGFMAITLTLILMQPSSRGLDADALLPAAPDPQEVSRAATPYDRTEPRPEANATSPAPVASADPVAQSLAALRPLDGSVTAAPATAAATNTPRADLSSADPSPQTLERLIISALSEGQNESYIDALVNDAADKGRIEVPGALLTADGRVDTATLLTVLSKSPDAMRAGARVYTVQPGDSLAAIGFRFYGATDRVDAIVDANATALASGLVVGQELVIPRN